MATGMDKYYAEMDAALAEIYAPGMFFYVRSDFFHIVRPRRRALLLSLLYNYAADEAAKHGGDPDVPFVCDARDIANKIGLNPRTQSRYFKALIAERFITRLVDADGQQKFRLNHPEIERAIRGSINE